MQLIFLPFTYWAEVNLCTLINRRWERIIISARLFTDFQEKIVVTVLTTTSSVVFSKVHMCFFPWVGSSVRHSVPKFVGSLLNHLYRCANENVTVKPLSLIWFGSILSTISSLKNCPVYGRSSCNYSPKPFGFFWKEFRWV